jgi:tRNA (cmo5U34)-methyltransferase
LKQQKDEFEEMAGFFDQRAAAYEAHMAEKPQTQYWQELFGKQIKITHDTVKVLDLGCGTGRELKYLFRSQPNARITCVDLSEGMLQQLKSKYVEKASQISIIQQSYFDYSFQEQQFDLVVACVTMHHWLYAPKLGLYQKIYHTLQEGGQFIDSDYMVPEAEEKEFLRNYQNQLESGQIAPDRFYHIDIPFSVKTETKVLKEAGFQDIRIIDEYYSKSFSAAMLVATK